MRLPPPGKFQPPFLEKVSIFPAVVLGSSSGSVRRVPAWTGDVWRVVAHESWSPECRGVAAAGDPDLLIPLIRPHVAGMRNTLILARFAVLGALTAGSSIGCGSAPEAFDCQQVCERYRDAFDSSYDVGGCEDRCRTNAANDPSVQAVSADLRIVDPKIRRRIRFEVPFDHIPDFLTVDQTGRPEDSFQYYLAYDPTQQADSGTVQGAIVRGDEIHIATALRIRNALPASTDPSSGGWGTVRATVPFEMRFKRDGSAVLSFIASWSDLGISGPFAWVLETFHFGADVGSLKGVFSEL